MQDWRLRQVANALNGSTALGLAIAVLGGAKLRRGERGLVLAEGYRWGFPIASAFTVGDVIATRTDFASIAAHMPDCLAHEERHAEQYALSMGLPFLPLYIAGLTWSWLRTGDLASANPFERHAGLVEGGYVERPKDNAGLHRLMRRATKRST